ncbi:MAG: hypothetical protein H6Q70_402 [Firmicutes bacterium]|nr:hypothetical protein [Bacillota bacterium]
MVDFFKALARVIWNKLILQKAQRVERRAMELLKMPVPVSGVPQSKIAPHAFDDLNTGKLKKFIKWLKSN